MVLLGAVSTLVIAVLMAATLGMLVFAGRMRRRARLTRDPHRPGPGAEAALRRHPAGRARHVSPQAQPADGQAVPPQLRSPLGPDDDPDFISSLEWLIRGEDPGAQP